eukprot:CCRYP_003527-RA/>CCRYP_003527-RA protein AED:0.44 eAED:0.44 QI:0/-1/0/1/-1/0/1/0/38
MPEQLIVPCSLHSVPLPPNRLILHKPHCTASTISWTML